MSYIISPRARRAFGLDRMATTMASATTLAPVEVMTSKEVTTRVTAVAPTTASRVTEQVAAPVSRETLATPSYSATLVSPYSAPSKDVTSRVTEPLLTSRETAAAAPTYYNRTTPPPAETQRVPAETAGRDPAAYSPTERPTEAAITRTYAETRPSSTVITTVGPDGRMYSYAMPQMVQGASAAVPAGMFLTSRESRPQTSSAPSKAGGGTAVPGQGSDKKSAGNIDPKTGLWTAAPSDLPAGMAPSTSGGSVLPAVAAAGFIALLLRR